MRQLDASLIDLCVSDILNKYMMLKSSLLVKTLISIVEDGLHNSKKVPIDSCEEYLAKAKTRVSQVQVLQTDLFIDEVISQTKS